MKKKTNIKTVIRQIVREEVALAIKEVITEITKPTQQVSKPKPKRKTVEQKSFSKNSVLNDVLNETVADEEWKTMGGGTYDSSRANEIMSSQYGNMMNNNDTSITVDGQSPDFLQKDFSKILKQSYKKRK
tara:strand:- start:125 stop:514 length:390 start_codon:yes stop_codon:yes gene_type:complete